MRVRERQRQREPCSTKNYAALPIVGQIVRVVGLSLRLCGVHVVIQRGVGCLGPELQW